MRSPNIVLATTLVAAIGIAGCTGDDSTGPGTGTLRVTTAPGGDPDGYTVRVDDGEEQPVGPGASIDFEGLTSGDHQVWLAGVAEHCVVTGDNPRTLTVTAGATALTIFQVTCSNLLGSLEITTVMSGESLDPDGFGFSVDGRVLSTPPGVTRATLPGLLPGEHTIALSGIALNCTPMEGPTRTVTVPPSGSAAIEFRLICAFIGITIWDTIPLPSSVNAAPRYDGDRTMWGTSASDLFLIAQAPEPGRHGIWHYDGAGWTEQVSRIDTVLNGIWGFSSTDVYAVGHSYVGYQAGQPPSGALLHYDGSVWSDVPGPVPDTGAAYFGVWGPEPGDLFVSGYSADLPEGTLLAHFKGQAWSRPTTDFGAPARFRKLSGTSASDVWAIGDHPHCDDCNNVTAMVVHYDGQEWRQSFSQSADVFSGVWATAPNDVWVVGLNPEYTASVLHYDGVAWSRTAPSPDFPYLADVWASSPSDVYAVGERALLHYDGRAWSQVSNVGGKRIWGLSREDVFILQEDAVLHGTP